MKNPVICILIVLSVLSMTILNVEAQNRIALVIGNSNYANSPLKNPANDATDMANALKQYGYDVSLKINVGHRIMERSIQDFGKRLKNSEAGLFYYAGHGIQIQGQNYLIPIGAEIESQGDVKFEAVDAGVVLAKMADAGKNLNIVILDASRYNPFSQSFKTEQKGLAGMDAPKGTLITYATEPGSQASYGRGKNGIYTNHLIRNIKNTQLSVEQVFKNSRDAVMSETSSKQIPWVASSLKGKFYFNQQPKQKGLLNKVFAEKQPSKNQTELLFWDSIKESKDPEMFEAYLEQFPNGIFSTLATINIKKYSATPNLKQPTISEKSNIQKQPEIGSENVQYSKDKNGIVYDRKTGLEWIAGPDKIIYWDAADKWVKSLKIGGSWRLPTIEELKTLYKKKSGPRNMPPEIKTSGWYVWSGEQIQGEHAARGFDFNAGQAFSYGFYISDTSGDTTWYDGSGSTSARVFGVRKR